MTGSAAAASGWRRFLQQFLRIFRNKSAWAQKLAVCLAVVWRPVIVALITRSMSKFPKGKKRGLLISSALLTLGSAGVWRNLAAAIGLKAMWIRGIVYACLVNGGIIPDILVLMTISRYLLGKVLRFPFVQRYWIIKRGLIPAIISGVLMFFMHEIPKSFLKSYRMFLFQISGETTKVTGNTNKSHYDSVYPFLNLWFFKGVRARGGTGKVKPGTSLLDVNGPLLDGRGRSGSEASVSGNGDEFGVRVATTERKAIRVQSEPSLDCYKDFNSPADKAWAPLKGSTPHPMAAITSSFVSVLATQKYGPGVHLPVWNPLISQHSVFDNEYLASQMRGMTNVFNSAGLASANSTETKRTQDNSLEHFYCLSGHGQLLTVAPDSKRVGVGCDATAASENKEDSNGGEYTDYINAAMSIFTQYMHRKYMKAHARMRKAEHEVSKIRENYQFVLGKSPSSTQVALSDQSIPSKPSHSSPGPVARPNPRAILPIPHIRYFNSPLEAAVRLLDWIPPARWLQIPNLLRWMLRLPANPKPTLQICSRCGRRSRFATSPGYAICTYFNFREYFRFMWSSIVYCLRLFAIGYGIIRPLVRRKLVVGETIVNVLRSAVWVCLAGSLGWVCARTFVLRKRFHSIPSHKPAVGTCECVFADDREMDFESSADEMNPLLDHPPAERVRCIRYSTPPEFVYRVSRLYTSLFRVWVGSSGAILHWMDREDQSRPLLEFLFANVLAALITHSGPSIMSRVRLAWHKVVDKLWNKNDPAPSFNVSAAAGAVKSADPTQSPNPSNNKSETTVRSLSLLEIVLRCWSVLAAVNSKIPSSPIGKLVFGCL